MPTARRARIAENTNAISRLFDCCASLKQWRFESNCDNSVVFECFYTTRACLFNWQMTVARHQNSLAVRRHLTSDDSIELVTYLFWFTDIKVKMMGRSFTLYGSCSVFRLEAKCAEFFKSNREDAAQCPSWHFLKNSCSFMINISTYTELRANRRYFWNDLQVSTSRTKRLIK